MSESRAAPTSTTRTGIAFLVIAAVIVLVSAVAAVTGASVPFRNDFAAYWPVANLLLDGQNPYDAAAIEQLQQSVGDELGGDSVVRYPPWSLPLLLPLASLPYAPGWYLWISLQMVLVAVGALWVWRLLGGKERSTVPLAVAVLFPPSLFVALGGQIDGVLLLGATVFLWGMLNGRVGIAGASLGLLTMKPHLFLALGLASLFWSIRNRQVRLLATAGLFILIGSLVALLFRPQVFADYLAFIQSPSTSWTRAVALGSGLSAALGGGLSWLKWIPALLVAAAIVTLAVRRRGNPETDWQREFPTLLLLGLLAAPYLLVHDLVLLVPAVLSCCLCFTRSGIRAARVGGAVLFLLFCAMIWIGQLYENAIAIHVMVVPLMLFPSMLARSCIGTDSPVEIA
ncbi:MAG: DUF2029 domain-containing protein [marine benthic group bacterium]|jgi:hypothetical protein|nr:DUF2029 domain-containing protein [Gemmatimonadota bacterium]MCL7936760.1 DUF2029 domain-containing protein [Gemmatimonadota bacterium]MCL7969425.1 DUF2029 domain-containing protein [Gemmatimonadota bacterium]MCL7973619.1 DUF2029 domain-containing protein [Gemmatimonadota bacterium]MCL7977490.1 DUF2029 domain-containing protein [Gemmatimonadota bacterium]